MSSINTPRFKREYFWDIKWVSILLENNLIQFFLAYFLKFKADSSNFWLEANPLSNIIAYKRKQLSTSFLKIKFPLFPWKNTFWISKVTMLSIDLNWRNLLRREKQNAKIVKLAKKESCLKYNTPTHDMINCFSRSGSFEMLLKPWSCFRRRTLKAMKSKTLMREGGNLFGYKRFHVFNYLYWTSLPCFKFGEFRLSNPPIKKAFHHFWNFQFNINFSPQLHSHLW